MLKLPVFKIIPLLESYYIEQIGNERIPFSTYSKINKSIKRLKKSTSDPLKWVYIQTETKKSLVLMKKSGDSNLFMSGPLMNKSAKTDKDLEYWKKMLLNALKSDSMEKSLEDILFPGITALPEKTQNLLLKARGYPIGTKRTWSGKEYKKVSGGTSGKGKWVRTYSETESRGAKQAIRNVQKKIMDASSMEDLLQIVEENSARFQDKDGKMLPIVKEFISAARGTDPGKKEIPIEEKKEVPKDNIERKRQFATGSFEMDSYEAEELTDNLNDKISISGVEFTFTEDDGDIIFYAEVERENSTENIIVNPYDLMEIDKLGLEDLLSIETKDIEPEMPETDYEAQEDIKEKKTPIKPNTPAVVAEEAQVAIEEANPVNRQQKTLEIAGTLPEAKTEEEVVKEQGTEKIKPVVFSRDITLDTSNEGVITGKISGIDTSVIDHREVLLTSYKSIQKSGEDWKNAKPEWMPEIDYKNFDSNNNSIIFTKLSDGKYLVPIAQKYKPHGAKRRYKYKDGPWTEEETNNFEGTEYAIMSLGQVAATQDFYRKVSKSLNDAKYQERVAYYKERGYSGKPKKSRIKVLAKNKMLYDHSYIYKEVNGANTMKEKWASHRELQDSLKQKTIDMDLMKEEVDNAFSKGNETSYGDSNTSNALENDYGVKIKRQDGSDISTEDQKYLSDAMSSIQKTFGERNSMNESFGLKLSFAKGTAMHARKAVGLFVPSQHAIGLSDGKGLKKKHPITGEIMKVDYGDENFGGFVLSHEYAHMMDYYLGSKTGEWYASDDNTGTAGQIASEFRSNMNMESKSDYINRTCECFARALEQYHAMETAGPEAMSFNTAYIAESQYVDKDTFDSKIKPLVEKFFQENDLLLKAIDIIW